LSTLAITGSMIAAVCAMLGMQAGVDLARGPEDTAIYLTIGSAW
jgi:hypothetical protein